MASSMVPSTTIASVTVPLAWLHPSLASSPPRLSRLPASSTTTLPPLPAMAAEASACRCGFQLGRRSSRHLSYLPPLSQESLAKEVDYLLRMGWIPCLEFELQHGCVYRENHMSPGYYNGRYWTMWKLPMFGCTDSLQVLKELEEAKKAYPNAFIRIIGFDKKRQVQ